ncbi:MAG: hypothetical protein LUQ09_02545 [Methanomassiliicoccales archaeon]|nr:hypothetical protein [Methanomassiliicoccales archaeon]
MPMKCWNVTFSEMCRRIIAAIAMSLVSLQTAVAAHPLIQRFVVLSVIGNSSSTRLSTSSEMAARSAQRSSMIMY